MNNSVLVTIFGRLGADPELKYTQKQEPVCTLSVAENVPGEYKARWHKVKVWGGEGESCKLNLKKGQQVFVHGRIQTHAYEAQGENKTSVEVTAKAVGLPV